jgi:hypothetical protein
MQVLYWTVQALALFSLQYSYKSSREESDYIRVANGTLRSCIYEGDRAFKRGSSTYPRAEARLLGSLPDGQYKAGVDVKEFARTPHIDYSLWQLFGSGPLVMSRYRQGGWQLVVFDGKPKIQKLTYPALNCVITCNESVICDQGVKSVGKIKCKNKLYMKIGAYAQQMEPNATLCVTYGAVYIEKV